MAVDYLSALNVGSGLNVTQIVDAIVEAERAPQETIIQKKIDEKSVSVSALGTVKSNLSTLDTNLQTLEGLNGLALSSSSTAVLIEETGTFSVQPFEHELNISQIAKSHTVSFAGFTSATATSSTESIQIEFGEWNSAKDSFTLNAERPAQTINIGTGPNTITAIADAVNAANVGVTASVIKLSEGSYSVSFMGPTGLDNQMRITSTGSADRITDITATTVEGFDITIPAPTPGTSGTDLERFVNEHAGGTFSISGDAEFTINTTTGEITSTDMIAFTDGANRTLTRTYTSGSNTISETVFITVTEDTAKTVIRQARSELDIHNLEGLTINAISGSQSGATRGSLSAELATFVSETRALNGTDGTFSLGGADSSDFVLNPSTGAIVYSNAAEITTDKNLTLTYQAANGDTFTETIVIDHDITHASIYESEINVIKSGSSTVVYDLGNNLNFSSGLQAKFNSTSNPVFSLSGAPAGVTVNHVEEMYRTSGVDIGSSHSSNDVYQLVVGSTTLTTAGSSYSSLNDVISALQLDSDYAGAAFTISDTNGATSGGEIQITYKTGGPLTDQTISFTKVEETERYRSSTSINIGTDNQQNDVFTLNVGSTSLSTPAAPAVGGYTSLDDVITALQADSNYAGAPFTIDQGGSAATPRLRITYKDPGDQGNVNISFAKTAGVADVNFNNGGFDNSVKSPLRDGYGNQTGFSNGGFNNTQQTPVSGFEGRYALEFDFSDSSLNVTGTQIDFDLALNDGSSLVHTEKVSFTVAAGGSDAVSLKTDNGPVVYTVSTAEMSVTNNTTTEPDYENTATTSDLSLSINYNPQVRDADARHFAMAGQNALFTFNGVDIIREENEVEDLISGVKLTLVEPTTSSITISSTYDKDQAKTYLDAFVSEVNTAISSLTAATFRGTPGEDDEGPLASDNLVKSYLRELKNLTIKPLPGYGDEDVYLSNFGVMTERDGSLTIDQTKFEQYFDANPDAFAAVMDSRATASSSLVKPAISGDDWEAGKYSFDLTSATSATLQRQLPTTSAEATATAMTLENQQFKINSGGAKGLAVTLLGDGEDANIYLGKSLLEILREFIDPILGTGNEIDTRITNYNGDLADYQEDLTALNQRIENTRTRYTKQFTDMETAVNSFNKTRELLDNFQEAWKASLNN